MSIPAQKLGWMAGIIDLKGRVVYKNNRSRKTKQIVLMVATKEFGIIRSLSTLTGSSPELQAPQLRPDFMRRSCHEHCPEKHVHIGAEAITMPPVACWTMTGAGMAVVLHNLLPFLTVDRGWEQAMETAFNQTVLRGPGSGKVKESLNRLQSLGWKLPILYAAALLPDEEEEDE